jgi:hypothetical protein
MFVGSCLVINENKKAARIVEMLEKLKIQSR